MKNNGWKSCLWLEIVEKNEQICTVKFQNFLGAMPQDPHTGEGLRRPSPDPTPLGTPALRASVPRSGSGPSAPPSSLSVCI